MQISLISAISIMKIIREDLISIEGEDVFFERYANMNVQNVLQVLNNDQIFSDVERTVLILASFGQSYQSIASELKLSHAIVSSIDRDARRKLRDSKSLFCLKT